MAILVTGGAGYIGSHTVLRLLEQNYKVIVIDNYSNSSPESLKRVSEICNRSPIVQQGDICDRYFLRKIFESYPITDVIHFAGLKSVSESCVKPIEYYHNNVCGGMILLEEMQRYCVNRLIFSSSATVYGEPERVPLDELSKVGGTTNPYGTSKYIFERILEDVSIANPKMNITVLRYFNPVGAHQSGKIGEDPNGIPNNLIPFISQVAVGRLEYLSVFGNDYLTIDGTGVRDYIHVMDLADGHIAALENKKSNRRFNIYNLGTGVGHSVLEIIAAFERITKININYKIKERRAGDIAECWADPSLAEKELGWKALRSIDDMMRDSWSWQKKNPNGY
ncbi:UDP-glucose 4-epimerase GalE [Candidatus Symbiopectobacterium sp. NZEC135]|uniref:UDP-glucose 4-epimerase GalE n=1 Tax=Candidatus Symbiopectobacterium sp. NZEC135 TaxID=2820471 RepID=UPI002226C215|nr:UDP-glucose 4-epimerase GalE [Candidatus Symbiopectobacterium sp. NZEC135]MCW2481605.1 UDP-glucose 4-epimerase GalE [Candidatus Symbiopectobacterium sp. NZEC135]